MVAMSRKAFRSGGWLTEASIATLQAIMRDPRLPGFVLALANILHDETLYRELWPYIEPTFAKIISLHADDLAAPETAGEKEDLTILRRIFTYGGLERLTTTKYGRAGDWVVVFNELRCFRPRNVGNEPTVSSIYRGWNDREFHFDKHFLIPECIWTGRLCGRQAKLFFNKYPFAKSHTVLVLEAERHHIQFMSEDVHKWLWRVAEFVGESIEGFGMGFNSTGAYASVNHLHSQPFVERDGLPIQDRKWDHNGGTQKYPLPVSSFTDVRNAGEWLRERFIHNEAYNLIYLPGRMLAWKRKKQGTYQHDPWTSGFAWFEGGGEVIAFTPKDFTMLCGKPQMIVDEFNKII